MTIFFTCILFFVSYDINSILCIFRNMLIFTHNYCRFTRGYSIFNLKNWNTFIYYFICCSSWIWVSISLVSLTILLLTLKPAIEPTTIPTKLPTHIPMIYVWLWYVVSISYIHQPYHSNNIGTAVFHQLLKCLFIFVSRSTTSSIWSLTRSMRRNE